MRKALWFILGMFLFCAIAELAYGQNFTNLPPEIEGKITAENSGRIPFGGRYVVLLITNPEVNPLYYVTYHTTSARNLSAGVRMDNHTWKHWIFKDGEWQEATSTEAAKWLEENDVPESEV